MSWASSSVVLSISLFCSVGLLQLPQGNAALIPEEEDALEILRERFSLSNWTGDPCDSKAVDWITCSDNSVSTLNLQQRNLTGTIPAEVAKLRHISSLELSRNSLSGPLPDLRNMTDLSIINLSNNPLGSSFPDVSELTELTSLDLTQTQMTGIIPASLESLRILETLLLGSNPQLNGSPTVMNQLPALKKLNGSYCGFSGRLPDIRNAGGLEDLDLQMNDFSGSIPGVLFQHLSLQWLRLNNNPKLSGEIPNMKLLKDIIALYANDCNLSGPLRTGSFSNNVKLQYIGLQNNRLTEFPTELQNLIALQTVGLQNNRLTEFPTDLQNLIALQTVDVHNNNMTGVLPDLPPGSAQSPSTGVTWLIFSNNNFYGHIPTSWNELTYVEGMLLAFNNLSGVIRKEIGTLTSLKLLNVSNNYFSGSIPEELGGLNSHLEILDLRNNQFTGTVPSTLASLTNLHTLLLDNNKFTGIPVSLTNKRNLTISYENNPGIKILYSTSKSGISTGTVVGVVIGACAFLATIVFIAIMLYKKKTKRKSGDQLTKEDMPKSAQGFTLKQIKVITENYKTLIGKGGFGPVYYGKLSDGKEVAVKVRATDSKQGAKEFLNEVRLLSRLHHRNLVSLVGYCLEAQEQILVYAFMSQGSLHDHLYHKVPASSGGGTNSSDPSANQPLTWKTRLNIAVRAARGLEYLHKDCNPAVIHRDVKSSNILLTDKLQAKVADFGISKQAPDLDSGEGFSKSGLSTVIKGTPGYLDPEYFVRRRLTTKSDVYSFGIVLLEIITAKRPQTARFHDSEATNLIDWVREAVTSDRLESIIDPTLQGGHDREGMLRVVRVALSCVSLSGPERPEMGDIARTLTQALQMEGEYLDTSSSATQEILPLYIEQELPLSSASPSSSFSAYSHPSWATDAR